MEKAKEAKERELALLGPTGEDEEEEDEHKRGREYRGSKDWGFALRLIEADQKNISRLEFLSPINPALEALESAFHSVPHGDEGFKIIFPWDEHLKCFVLDEAHRDLALDSVTHEEIVMVFDGLCKSPYYDFYTNMHLKLAIPFVVLLVLAVIVYLVFRDTIHGSTAVAVTCVLVVVFLFGAIGVTCTRYWAIFLQERFNAREDDFNRILEKLNQDHFHIRGLSWRAGTFGTFIELSLDFLDYPH